MLPISKMLSLPAAVLSLCISHALGATLAARDEEAMTTIPAPIAFTPDQNWDGIDGQWSTFTLRIGTPEQYVRTFVSWSSYQTWAVLPEGCLAALNYQDCADSRGGVFNTTESSTWERVGIYDLWITRNLGINGNAIFGYDKVGIGGAGEEGPTLQNTTVGALAVEDFYLGIFGINPKPTNFTNFNDGATSYITQLKEQKYIPSVSFGYTAGAKYQYSGVLGSLTLGGYDETIAGQPVEFMFGPDNSRDTLPVIQSISTPSQDDSNPVGVELLPQPVYAYLDATVAEIWLPVEACEVFESEFGLVYDNSTELYLVNDTLHEDLLSRDASITFQLGQNAQGGESVSIELPYAAFDQTAKAPYQGLANETNYFPLRRAQNETQYTIGRTFFQEAYITVNYESQRYNVSQRTWSENATPHLIAIPPYTGSERSYPGATDPTSSSSSGLSGGAIAGIVVGAVAIIALLAGLAFCLYRRRSKASAQAAKEQDKLAGSDAGSTTNDEKGVGGVRGAVATVIPKAELDATDRFGASHYEADKNRLLHPGGGAASDSGYSGSVSSPRTPNGTLNPFSFHDSSPSSPSPGTGTHTSHGSSGQGSALISPLVGGGGGGLVTTAAEAGGRERARPEVFEMAGDMPVIREKDGHLLSEKEALAHRERVYNGVVGGGAAEGSSEEVERERERPARVGAEDVVVPSGLAMGEDGTAEERDLVAHQRFSFEFDRVPGEGSEGSSGVGTGESGYLVSP